MAELFTEAAASGTLWLTCRAALPFAGSGRRHDLVLEWRRRDGVWDREGLGHTPDLVSSLHEFRMAAGSAAQTIEAEGFIAPDAWTVAGGAIALAVTLADASGGATGGTFAGTYNGEAVAGEVEARFEAEPPASRGVAHGPLEILEAFERDGPAGRLYDFSYAGRGTTDPTPGLPVFDAAAYGARPDSGEEASGPIQAALDAAGEAGGGVVQLGRGVYDLSVDRKCPPLRIRHSHVVLRGAGSGPDGTLLVNHRYSDTPDPAEPWRAAEHPLMIIGPAAEPAPEPLTVVTGGARGGRELRVADAAGLRAGEAYLLRQLEADDGSLARDLVRGRVEVAADWRGAGTPLVAQLVAVEAVDGDRVRIDAPLHRGIGRWAAVLCRVPMLVASGVAGMRMRGRWGGYFVHHKNGEHDNGWDHVKLRRVRAGWVDDLVHEHTTSAIGLNDCLGCVVRRCRITGNPGHNGFGLGGWSTGNLYLGCHAGRSMHGFNVQGTPCGNAVVDASMDEPSAIDLHGGLGLDTLFDGLVGGVLKGGGAPHAVPPRHGPGLVLWNWCRGWYDPYKVWRRHATAGLHDETPGFVAVGVHGAYGQRIVYRGATGDVAGPLREPWGWVESPGQRVAPRSLVAWQRGRR